MFTLNCKGRLLVVEKPLIMGIINTTPDSFYAGSRYSQADAVLAVAEKMLKDGATFLDVGGQSTRPGSERVSMEDELKRVIGPVSVINKYFPEAYISIDTYYAEVAKEAVAAGACIVNDISAGKMDESMIATVTALNVPYVLTHMQGTPQSMQTNPTYHNVTLDVLDFFIQETARLKKAGITDIIIDPGFGFGKTIEHNFELLNNLEVFQQVNRPLMAGLSRKSLIYKTLGITAQEALNGTTVLNTIGLVNGTNILRVHDVKEASEVIKLHGATKKRALR
jgi:dihydropteroate synthase